MTTTPIRTLFVAHLMASITCGFLPVEGPSASSAVVLSLPLSQATLLGMWMGLGASRWPEKLLVVAIGTAYLTAVICMSFGDISLEISSDLRYIYSFRI